MARTTTGFGATFAGSATTSTAIVTSPCATSWYRRSDVHLGGAPQNGHGHAAGVNATGTQLYRRPHAAVDVDGRGPRRDPVVGDAAVQFLEGDPQLEPSEVGAQAAMEAAGEADVTHVGPFQIDLQRVADGVGVEVGRRPQDRHLGAAAGGSSSAPMPRCAAGDDADTTGEPGHAGSFGSPRTRSPMMERWISDAPA